MSRQGAAVAAHVERCSHCRSELALYRSYEEADGLADPEDLAWIVERLDAVDSWIGSAGVAFAVVHGVERLLAAVLFLALSPALFLVCLIILLKARRWPLIRHERVGRGGVAIRMLKFRTMWPADDRSASDEFPARKTCRDPRVTSRFAAFCRRFSIDELPQLLHVVTGEMSLVGPRPLTARELHRYYEREGAEVLSVRPGMAGLWQAMGRSRLTYAQRRRLDVFYVRHASFRLYFHILMRTVPKALTGKDAC